MNSTWNSHCSQAIFTLARRGDLSAVKRALELDADPNIPDTLGITAAGAGNPWEVYRWRAILKVIWWDFVVIYRDLLDFVVIYCDLLWFCGDLFCFGEDL